jgi:hypothetical protein
MPEMSSFEKEYYKWEGKYELMDPDKFYEDMPDYVENVQKEG